MKCSQHLKEAIEDIEDIEWKHLLFAQMDLIRILTDYWLTSISESVRLVSSEKVSENEH